MASQERWVAAAAEVLGMPVSDAVLFSRRKETAVAYTGAGAVIFGLAVFLHQFGVIPGPSWLVYLGAALPMSFLFQLSTELVFAALTPVGIEVISSTRWRSRPVGPRRGPLDPAVVSGPHGLLRSGWDIAGVRHQLMYRDRDRFQKMLAATSVGESTP